MTVDIHSHVIPPGWLADLRAQGTIEGVTLWEGPEGKEHIDVRTRYLGPKTAQKIPLHPKQYDVATILGDMDRERIDVRVISPMQFLFYYWVDPSRGLELNQLINDGIYQMAQEAPDQLIPVGILPMQNIEMCVVELERIVEELGMRAVEIGTNINGRELDDPDLTPFYKKAQELDILIFIHPYDVAGIERMDPYFLRNLVGNPFETSLAICRIVFGGIMESFPRLKFCLSHGGGAIPYIAGRLDHGYACRKECKKNIRTLPSAFLKKLYFDTIVFERKALELLLSVLGPDHVLLGSDYPFDMGESGPVTFVEGIESLTKHEKEKILGLNAIRLLGEPSL
jgi:aminocarboxymuconate-semialdehyde decarboxylase